jgi:hypothetical protein
MRVLACASMLMGAAFLIGRATAPDASVAAQTSHVYTGRAGDVFRVPAVAARCTVRQEGRSPDLYCVHTPRARHQVYFFRDAIFVWRVGQRQRAGVLHQATVIRATRRR